MKSGKVIVLGSRQVEFWRVIDSKDCKTVLTKGVALLGPADRY